MIVINKIVLIDAENVGCNTSVIKMCLEEYHKIYIIFSNLQAKIDFNTIADFSLDIKNDRLNIIRMEKVGKNSADFGLAFIAGQLSSTLEKGSIIEIRSKDLMFNNIVNMLNKCGMKAIQTIQHPIKSFNQCKEVADINLDISDIGTKDSIPIEAISGDEIFELNKMLSEENNMNVLEDIEINVVQDSFKIESSEQPINVDISNENHDYIIKKIHDFNIENKISFSNKTSRVLVYLIKIIQDDKYKRGASKSICDNFGNEKDVVKIIFNCIYIFGLFNKKAKTRTYQSLITHLSSTRGLSRHFATVFINYLCSCNMIKHSKGKITITKDLSPILNALECVVTDSNILK